MKQLNFTQTFKESEGKRLRKQFSNLIVALSRGGIHRTRYWLGTWGEKINSWKRDYFTTPLSCCVGPLRCFGRGDSWSTRSSIFLGGWAFGAPERGGKWESPIILENVISWDFQWGLTQTLALYFNWLAESHSLFSSCYSLNIMKTMRRKSKASGLRLLAMKLLLLKWTLTTLAW